MTLSARIVAFAEGLRDEGVPHLIAYKDAGHWNMAAPVGSWAGAAEGLRTLAEECDRLAAEDAGRTLN